MVGFWVVFYRFKKISYCFNSKTSELNIKIHCRHCPKRCAMEVQAITVHKYFSLPLFPCPQQTQGRPTKKISRHSNNLLSVPQIMSIHMLLFICCFGKANMCYTFSQHYFFSEVAGNLLLTGTQKWNDGSMTWTTTFHTSLRGVFPAPDVLYTPIIANSSFCIWGVQSAYQFSEGYRKYASCFPFWYCQFGLEVCMTVQDWRKDALRNGEAFGAEIISSITEASFLKPPLSWPQESLKRVPSCALPFLSLKHTFPAIPIIL